MDVASILATAWSGVKGRLKMEMNQGFTTRWDRNQPMSDGLASAAVIRTEHPDGSILYRLPGPTDLGPRLAGAAGIFLVLVVPLVVPLFLVPREQLLPVLVGAGFVLAVAAAIGVWFFFTRLRPVLAPREILVCRDGLVATTRLGPLHWSTRRSLALVDSLLIRVHPTREADLLVLSHGEPPLRLVQPLPPEQLRPFARELAEQVTRLDPGEGAAVEVREETAAGTPTAGQPRGSRIIVVEREGSLVITVPPAGLGSWKLAFLVVGGIAYVIGSLVTTVMIVLSLPAGGGMAAGQLALERLPNLLFNWLVGAYWLGYALHCCTRRIVLTVTGQALHIEMVSLFRDRRWHWSRQELVSITGNQHGLSMRPTQGIPRLIRWWGPGSGPAEYRWLAEILWQRLQAADEPFGAAGRDDRLSVGEEEP
jgi:hypothetical protein